MAASAAAASAFADRLCSQLSNMNIYNEANRIKEDNLVNDIAVILESWINQLGYLETHSLKIMPNSYASTAILYAEIVTSLRHCPSSTQACLLEIMPYIDDFLEYYESLCAQERLLMLSF